MPSFGMPPSDIILPAGQRVALAVEYDGAEFHGWQSQKKPNVATVQETLEQALSKVEMAAPVVPVVANVTAQAVSDPDTIRRRLVEQVTAPVRWRECVLYMRDNGVESLFELGAGKVLTTLARRIDRELAASAAGGPDEIEAMLKSF